MIKVSEMEARGSKNLFGGEPMRRPNWLVWTLMKALRMLLATVLWTGFGMGLGLFLGIVWEMSSAAIAHRPAQMALAYRHIAIPVAVTLGGCALLWNLYRTIQAGAHKARGH